MCVAGGWRREGRHMTSRRIPSSPSDGCWAACSCSTRCQWRAVLNANGCELRWGGGGSLASCRRCTGSPALPLSLVSPAPLVLPHLIMFVFLSSGSVGEQMKGRIKGNTGPLTQIQLPATRHRRCSTGQQKHQTSFCPPALRPTA